MNPRSGGGKVGRFALDTKSAALGAQVSCSRARERSTSPRSRDARSPTGDLLGVAGGDGTQALVAGIAAEHDLPFLVISAGTRNHFAMDLGLDRERPDTGLDALSDGVELRLDLGESTGGRSSTTPRSVPTPRSCRAPPIATTSGARRCRCCPSCSPGTAARA